MLLKKQGVCVIQTDWEKKGNLLNQNHPTLSTFTTERDTSALCWTTGLTSSWAVA